MQSTQLINQKPIYTINTKMFSLAPFEPPLTGEHHLNILPVVVI